MTEQFNLEDERGNRTFRLENLRNIDEIIPLDSSVFGGHPLLLGAYKKLYSDFMLPGVFIDPEGGSHYGCTLSKEQLAALALWQVARDFDSLDEVELTIEDRVFGKGLDRNPDYNMNSWGDATFELRLTTDDIETVYTLSVYMLRYDTNTYLRKHIHAKIPNELPMDRLVSDTMAQMGDPLEEETGFNVISDDEYNKIVRLISDIGLVIAKS